jgi:hypothetical protein
LTEKFLKDNEYLTDFVKIDIVNGNHKTIDKIFTSIFVCLNNHLESIKESAYLRALLGNNEINIITFYDGFDSLNEILNTSGENVLPFKDKNIFLINTFEETVKYVLGLDEESEMEIMAEEAHNMWRKKDEYGNFIKNDEYRTHAEHFKQSNRNQGFDFYLKTFIALKKDFDSLRCQCTTSFSNEEKESLAIMEHRRWMLEKYAKGWKMGEMRNNDFKIHPDLKPWELLPQSVKDKDFVTVDLMIEKLKKMVN